MSSINYTYQYINSSNIILLFVLYKEKDSNGYFKIVFEYLKNEINYNIILTMNNKEKIINIVKLITGNMFCSIF